MSHPVIRLILAAFLSLAAIAGSFAQTANQSGMVPNTAIPSGVAQNNLTASGSPSASNDQTQGYAVGSLWQNSSTGQIWVARSVATSAAVWTALELSDHPGYIVGNWYLQYSIGMLSSASAPGASSIHLYPAYIKERITLSSLGVRVSTLSASGNIQAAIYANNPATMRPTGNALASTASMSTSSLANVNSSVSVQLEPGLYWWATNCDNGTAIFTSISSGNYAIGGLIGSATQGNILFNGSALTGVTVSQTFGTWPSLTAATFTETTATAMPVVQFLIGSVP